MVLQNVGMSVGQGKYLFSTIERLTDFLIYPCSFQIKISLIINFPGEELRWVTYFASKDTIKYLLKTPNCGPCLFLLFLNYASHFDRAVDK